MDTTTNQKEKNLKIASAALSHIDADVREVWVKCGMGIKNEFGEEGFSIWDSWSQRSSRYSSSDARQQWDSFKQATNEKPIGIATVFFYAQNNGYKNDGSYKAINISAEAKLALNIEIEQIKAAHRELKIVAARKANEIWDAALVEKPSFHKYVIQKNIKPYVARLFQGDMKIGGMNCNGSLVLPIMKNNEIVSLQFISKSGEKRFLPNGEKASLWIDSMNTISTDTPICICEGYATGSSIHEATKYPVVIAFDAGSLSRTAKEVRGKYPTRKIILCADNEDSGVGLRSANEAAGAVGGYVALPLSQSHQNIISPCKDFNDFAKDDGLEEVKKSVDAAELAVVSKVEDCEDESPLTSSNNATAGTPKVTLTCASSVKPVAIKWVWKDWLAGGKFHILGGQAGTGKTTIALSLAAIISRGGNFPDGTVARQGNVLIWSGEDGIDDTLVPRLMASGADLNRVFFISGYQGDLGSRPFNPATDLNELEKAALSIGGIALMIIDPVVSVVTGDSHKNAEVRNSLKPLVDMGEKFGCAVLGITHFTKGTSGSNPLERITGSLAFGAVARIVMAAGKRVEKTKDDDDQYVENEEWYFCRAKSNIGPDCGGFQYELKQNEIGQDDIVASTIGWLKKVDGNAKDLLTDKESKEDGGKRKLDDAAAFLKRVLADSRLTANDVNTKAKKEGFSEATIKRAKEHLGVRSVKSGMSAAWYWVLPKSKSEGVQIDGQHAQPIDLSIFEEMNSFDSTNHLRQLHS